MHTSGLWLHHHSIVQRPSRHQLFIDWIQKWKSVSKPKNPMLCLKKQNPKLSVSYSAKFRKISSSNQTQDFIRIVSTNNKAFLIHCNVFFFLFHHALLYNFQSKLYLFAFLFISFSFTLFFVFLSWVFRVHLFWIFVLFIHSVSPPWNRMQCMPFSNTWKIVCVGSQKICSTTFFILTLCERMCQTMSTSAFLKRFIRTNFNIAYSIFSLCWMVGTVLYFRVVCLLYIIVFSTFKYSSFHTLLYCFIPAPYSCIYIELIFK